MGEDISVDEYKLTLRKLALRDDRYIDALLSGSAPTRRWPESNHAPTHCSGSRR